MQRFVVLRNKINENKGDHYNVDAAASVIFQHLHIHLQPHAPNFSKIIWQNDERLNPISLISPEFNDRFLQTQHRGYL